MTEFTVPLQYGHQLCLCSSGGRAEQSEDCAFLSPITGSVMVVWGFGHLFSPVLHSFLTCSRFIGCYSPPIQAWQGHTWMGRFVLFLERTSADVCSGFELSRAADLPGHLSSCTR